MGCLSIDGQPDGAVSCSGLRLSLLRSDSSRANLRNVVTLVASVGLALAFVLKDYGAASQLDWRPSSRTPISRGDWIEVDGNLRGG